MLAGVLVAEEARVAFALDEIPVADAEPSFHVSADHVGNFNNILYGQLLRAHLFTYITE